MSGRESVTATDIIVIRRRTRSALLKFANARVEIATHRFNAVGNLADLLQQFISQFCSPSIKCGSAALCCASGAFRRQLVKARLALRREFESRRLRWETI